MKEIEVSSKNDIAQGIYIVNFSKDSLMKINSASKGRPIISTTFAGKRAVLVGDELHTFEGLTFHDFLVHYLKQKLTLEWFRKESQEPEETRHPILKWLHELAEIQRKTGEDKSKTEIWSAPLTGSALSFLKLAHNIYLLSHNVKLEERLLKRLRSKDQFFGALYETFVAAVFIQSGFDIELEDEADTDTSHCEFTATNRKTGNKFSVEAKLRSKKDNDNIDNISVKWRVLKALHKKAEHKRIIFVDINFPVDSFEEGNKLFDKTDIILNDLEKTKNETAYIFVTNNPHYFKEHSNNIQSSVLIRGFNIPEFTRNQARSLHEAIEFRKKHFDIIQIQKLFRNVYDIPSGFSEDLVSEICKMSSLAGLTIGCTYKLPYIDENIADAILENIIVDEYKKKIYAIFRYIGRNESAIKFISLTEDDLEEYRKLRKQISDKINDTKQLDKMGMLEIYDTLYETYNESTKENLINFLENDPNINILKTKSQEELAQYYCERIAESIYFDIQKHSNRPFSYA